MVDWKIDVLVGRKLGKCENKQRSRAVDRKFDILVENVGENEYN